MIRDIKTRELLTEIRQLLETGIENCFGIRALCSNCQSKCKRQQKKEELKKRIDKIMEV